MNTSNDVKEKIPKIVEGELNLSGRDLYSLKSIKVDPNLVTLIISNNHIKSFKSLKKQPNLERIIADNNPIQFLTGLCDQPSLRYLDIRNTPISDPKNKQMEARVLATVGPKLANLNGNELTSEIQKMANIILKRRPNELFLPQENENDSSDEEESDPVRMESLIEMKRLYMKEMKGCFREFAANEAILYDLKRFGPMPVVTPNSSDEDVIKAIINISKRNNYLSQIIKENSNPDEEEDFDYD